jgi:hypothetical protein
MKMTLHRIKMTTMVMMKKMPSICTRRSMARIQQTKAIIATIYQATLQELGYINK